MHASSADVTIVIPNWNGSKWLPGCFAALAEQTVEPAEIVVVDNASEDDSVTWLRGHAPKATVIEQDRNYGFAQAVNAGIAACSTELVVLLNNDTVAAPTWLEALVVGLTGAPENVACLSSKMVRMSDPSRIDDAGDELSWQGGAYKRGHGQPATEYGDVVDVFSVCAGAAIYRTKALREIGGFDARFFAYLEDVDVGFRLRLRGYRCLFEPRAEIQHFGHGSGTPQPRYVRWMTRNRLLLFGKNMPVGLMARHGMKFLYGQIYFCVAYRHPLHSLAGYAMFVRHLPHVVRERKRNRRARCVCNEDLAVVFRDGLKERPLRDLLYGWVVGLLKRKAAS